MKPLTKNEKLTLVISSAALLVAGASLYMQFWYQVESMDAVIYEADPAGAELVLRIAVINRGNTAAMLLDLQPSVKGKPGQLDARLGPILSEVQAVGNKPPLLVDPGDIRTLTYRGPIDYEALYEVGSPPDPGFDDFDDKPTRKVVLNLRAEAMDIHGNVFDTSTGFLEMHLTTEVVAVWGAFTQKAELLQRRRYSR